MAMLFYVKLKNGTVHLFEAQHLALHNGSLTMVVTDSEARALPIRRRT